MCTFKYDVGNSAGNCERPAVEVPVLVPASPDRPHHLLPRPRPPHLSPLVSSPALEEGRPGQLAGKRPLLLKGGGGRAESACLTGFQARQVAHDRLHAFHRPRDSPVQRVQLPALPSSWEDDLPASGGHSWNRLDAVKRQSQIIVILPA